MRDRIYDEFVNSLYDSTSPNLIPQIYEQLIGNKEIIIIEIPSLLKKPCFIKRDGIPKGVYLRIGSTTRQASEEYIEELLRENQRVSYDVQAVQMDFSILTKSLLGKFYKKISKEALIEDKIITRSYTNAEIYYPTIAGVLLFSEEPEKYVHEAIIKCTRFEGTAGRNIIQTEEIKGPIEKQIDISFNLVMSWIKRDYQLKGVFMKSKTLIPEIALREVITNAAIHRKYSFQEQQK